ncbi:MAG: hypothetical protein A2Z16_15570 [Chloroflexi bacterium RBG_16_54_18]|nr:MAG: hypothetical protein A2Z16_15570 [Chloroflexi bacterium RBG_16_54_18]
MADSRLQNPFVVFFHISRPLFLLGAVLIYALGAGVADYLGTSIDWGVYMIGQAWVIALHLGAVYLFEYYIAVSEATNTYRDPPPGGDGKIGPVRTPLTMLVASAVSLTVVATLSVWMIRELRLSPSAWLVMLLACLGAVFYSVPPVRLAFSGYGELAIALLYANLLPAFAFILQVGDLHRLLAMSTFPLTTLMLALVLAFELPDYALNIKQNRRTLMVRVGWQRGMGLHNAMIFGAFLLVGLALTFGMPLFIGLPALLPLPLGLLQVWQMRRISEGAKPNWMALKLTAVVLFATTTYLLTFAFWTR